MYLLFISLIIIIFPIEIIYFKNIFQLKLYIIRILIKINKKHLIHCLKMNGLNFDLSK